MSATLRILLLEDVPTDAELVERELRRAKIDFGARRVWSREAFETELASYRPDAILADFSLPGFGGLDAMEIAQRESPHTPFIFVSGAIGEERAIDTLKKGATDYVLKDRLSRLGPALERALREAEERRERHRAEKALRHSEERHRVLLEVNNAIIASLDRLSLFDAIAKALARLVLFERAGLTLHDPHRDVIQVYAQTMGAGSPRLPTVREFPRKGSTFDRLLREREPVVRHDLSDGDLVPPEDQLLRDGIRSYVSVPLIVKDNVVGSLNVGASSRESYREADVELLNEVGTQVALAIANLIAYEEITRLKARLEQENIYLQEEIQTERDLGEIVGESAALAGVLKAVETVAPTDTTVLICGETGTGKEVVARAIHELSPHKDKPLVTVNCAALPATLIESELFGHEKGAFTGALARKIGRFELADGGSRCFQIRKGMSSSAFVTRGGSWRWRGMVSTMRPPWPRPMSGSRWVPEQTWRSRARASLSSGVTCAGSSGPVSSAGSPCGTSVRISSSPSRTIRSEYRSRQGCFTPFSVCS